MARGRMINSAITEDKRVHELSDDTSRLAFTWLIAFADCEGRVPGDPAIVRSRVFPRRDDITTDQMERYIGEWAQLGLIVWYEANDDLWIQFSGFEKNQAGLRKNREPESRIPAPPEPTKTPEECQDNPADCRLTSVTDPTNILLKRKEEKLKEEKDAPPPSGFIADAIHAYENVVGIVAGQHQSEEIVATLEELHERGHPEWWELALNEAADHNARRWAYIRAILRNWIDQGRCSVTAQDECDARASPKTRVVTIEDQFTGERRTVEARV